MKKFINIILTLGLIAFTASCVKEYGPHEPGEPDNANCYGVYFPVQEGTGAHTFDPTQPTEADIIVARQHANGAITVPVEIVDEKGVFNVEPITFADGQSETVLHITFPNAEIGVEYPLSVTITDPDYALKYDSGATSFDFSVFRVEWKTLSDPTTGEPAEVTFYEEWWDEVHVTRIKYYEVDGIRTCIAYTDNPDEGVWGMKTDFTFTWNTKTNKVDIPQNFMGWDYDDQGKPKPESDCSSPVYVFDWYSYFVMRGQYSKDVDSFYAANGANYPRSYYDPQTGIFYLNCQFYIIGLGGWTGLEYDTEAWVSGFVRTDYSLEVEPDFSDEGVVPFYFTAGVDVSAVKYVVKEGELTATQASKVADAIADGSEECQTISEFEYNEDDNVNEAYLEIEFEETNFYTLVAVSFDETGAPKESASATCFAVAAGDDSYDVQIIAGLEDTPARFQDFDRTSSLGFYIAGKEITDLKFDIFKASDVKKVGLDAVVADIRESDSVDEDVLASVNSVGGFASVFDELDALTEYTLVVWATNGSKDKVVVSSLATDGLPNEVIASGAFTGGALLFGEYFVTPTTVEYNPNTEHFEIPNFLDFDAPLVFDLNSDDNTIDVLPSYSGIDYAAGAPINVYEASDVYLDLTKYGLPADAHSYLDEETGKYFFCLAYYVPAVGGFGAAYETFEVGEGAEEVAENAESVTSTVSTVGCKPGVASLIRKPKVTSVRYERDPMSASFSVKSVSAKVRNRNVEKNHSLIRINNTDVIF